MGIFSKLKESLKKTKDKISDTFAKIFEIDRIGEEFYDELTDALISSDLSVRTAMDIVDELRDSMIENIVKDKDQVISTLKEILVSGLVIGLVVFVVWNFLLNNLNMEVAKARGYIMALMVFIQNIHVFNCRSESNSAFNVPLKNNYLIVGGVFVSILLQIIVMEVPFMSKFLKTVSIPFMDMLFLFLIALIVLLVMEIYKMVNNISKK